MTNKLAGNSKDEVSVSRTPHHSFIVSSGQLRSYITSTAVANKIHSRNTICSDL